MNPTDTELLDFLLEFPSCSLIKTKDVYISCRYLSCVIGRGATSKEALIQAYKARVIDKNYSRVIDKNYS